MGGDAQGAFGSSSQSPEGIRKAQSMLAQLLEVNNSPIPQDTILILNYLHP